MAASLAMRQLDLISRSRVDKKKRTHRLRGYFSSFLFHAVLLGLIVELSFLYRSQLPLPNHGSEPGACVISLQTMTIIASPKPPAPALPLIHPTPLIAKLPVSTPSAIAAVPTPNPLPPQPKAMPHPEIGVPVLAGPAKPAPAALAKSGPPLHQVATTTSTGGRLDHLRPATAKFVSSFTPGPSDLPHPPYPTEARDLQQTGTVRMLIQFDRKGNVARADVAQSSGVAVLDSETRSFIRTNWHSLAYAGQSVTVPVEYTLTSL